MQAGTTRMGIPQSDHGKCMMNAIADPSGQ